MIRLKALIAILIFILTACLQQQQEISFEELEAQARLGIASFALIDAESGATLALYATGSRHVVDLAALPGGINLVATPSGKANSVRFSYMLNDMWTDYRRIDNHAPYTLKAQVWEPEPGTYWVAAMAHQGRNGNGPTRGHWVELTFVGERGPPDDPVDDEGLQPLGASGDWQLTFSDDFHGNSLNLNKWRTGLPYAWDQHRDGAVSVSGGLLRLAAGGAVHSTLTQEHGFFEARISFPGGRGRHSAFWLWAWDQWAVNWPNGYWSEIDVAELFNSGDSGALYRVLHWGQGGPSHNHHMPRVWRDWTRFHTFGVEWRPGQVRFYLDGVPTAWVSADLRGAKTTILSTGFESNVSNPDQDGVMLVSYVRIWQ